MLKVKFLWVLVLVFAMLVAGCGEATEDVDVPDPDEDEVVDDDAVVEDEEVFIGWAVPYLDRDDSFGFYERAVRDHLDELGVNYTLDARAPDSHSDHAGQLAIIEDFIAMGVDYMVIAPTCFEGQQPAYRAVINAGIPMVIMGYLGWEEDFDVPPSDDVYFVGYSHTDAGIVNAEWVADNYPEGTKIAVVHGTPGYVTDARTQVDLHIENGMEIVTEQNADYDRATAYRVTEDILAAFPPGEVDLLMPANSAMAVGVAEALADSGRDDVEALGCGGTVEELVDVARGRMVASWVRSHFDEGIAAAEIIYAYVQGRQDELPQINEVEIYMVESLEEIKNVHDERYHEYIIPHIEDIW